MSMKFKCASLVALYCNIVVCASSAIAQDVAEGSDCFCSGGAFDEERSTASAPTKAVDSAESARLLVWTEAPRIAPSPLVGRTDVKEAEQSQVFIGDVFSGYGPHDLKEIESYFDNLALTKDPFQSQMTLLDAIARLRLETKAKQTLVIGRSFPSEIAWDAYFAGRRKFPPYAVESIVQSSSSTNVDSIGQSASARPLSEPRWSLSHGPLRVYISGVVSEARNGLVASAILAALRDWRNAANGAVRFIVTDRYVDADVLFVCENTVENQWAENIVSYHNGMFDRVKVRFIEEALYELEPKRLRAICLHEVGHVFGIRNHSTDKRDAMSVSATDDLHPTLALTNNDRKSIVRLYP